MEKVPMTCLTWRGQETIESVMALLDRTMRIEIELPANYNHALFSLLHPGKTASAVESVDRSAGPELLTEIASLAGLEKLGELKETLSTKTTIRIVSPPRVIITLPEQNREQ